MPISPSERRLFIFGSRASAIAAKKANAKEGSAFNCEYAAIEDAVSEAWGLFGNGTQIVSDTQRTLIWFKLLQGTDLPKGLSSATAISSLIKIAYKQFLDGRFAKGLGRAGEQIVALMSDYQREISVLGLAEPVEAQDAFLRYCDGCNVSVAFGQIIPEPYKSMVMELPVEMPLEGLGDLRVPAIENIIIEGHAAIYSTIISCIEGSLNDSDGACACKRSSHGTISSDVLALVQHPTELLEAMVKSGECFGIDATVEDSVSIGDTEIGRALINFMRLRLSPSDFRWKEMLTDLIYTPYAMVGISKEILSATKGLASMSPKDAFNLYLRADRVLSLDQALRALGTVSDVETLFNGILQGERDLESSIGTLVDIAVRSFSGLDRERELTALAQVKALLEDCNALGFQEQMTLEVLEGSSFSLSYAISSLPNGSGIDQDGARPKLRIMQLSSMGSLLPKQYDTVIVEDLSSDSLSSSRGSAAVEGLLRAVFDGHPDYDYDIERARWSLRNAYLSSINRFVCLFSDRDKSFNETYRSFAYDEFLEGKLFGNVNHPLVASLDTDISEQVMARDLKRFDERCIQASIGCGPSSPKGFSSFIPVDRGRLNATDIMEFLNYDEDASVDIPLLSPSAIDEYLSCPYKWFLSRELGASDLDEGFGNLEKGSFSHRVYEVFYELADKRFEGAQTIYDVPEDEVVELFGETFRRVYEEQFELPPNSGRLVPQDGLERESIKMLYSSMLATLLSLRRFSKDFNVEHREYPISPSKIAASACAYGNVLIRGKIDRMDKALESDRFVIIDYKGSTKGYAAGLSADDYSKAKDDGIELPDHVQALVYAQVMRHALKEGGSSPECEGALYASYKHSDESALFVGSYEQGSPGIAPFSNDRSSVSIPFGEYLDLIEQATSHHIDELLGGSIPEQPKNANACRWCLYSNCARRL